MSTGDRQGFKPRYDIGLGPSGVRFIRSASDDRPFGPRAELKRGPPKVLRTLGSTAERDYRIVEGAWDLLFSEPRERKDMANPNFEKEITGLIVIASDTAR